MAADIDNGKNVQEITQCFCKPSVEKQKLLFKAMTKAARQIANRISQW